MSEITGKNFKLFIDGGPTVDGLPGQMQPLSGTSAGFILGDELHLEGEATINFVDKEWLRDMEKKAAEEYERAAREAYQRWAGVNTANEETLQAIAKAFRIPPEKLR